MRPLFRFSMLAALLALPACSDDAHLRASGTIEMDEVDVASLIGGRVVRLLVNEGDTVRVGDTLAVLDRGEVVAELEAQAAQSERAVAIWRDLRSGPRAAEVEAARAELSAATARWRQTETDFKRIEALHRDRVVSQAELDRATTEFEAALARRRSALEQLALLEAGYRREQVEAAEKAASAARAQVRAAVSRAGELVLTAPVRGVVLLKNFEPGELAQPGVPVVTLGNPDSLWMRVYVAAPQLGRVRLGAPAEVRVLNRGLGHPARVVQIATRAEFTPRAALTEEEQANLVFAVKLRIEPPPGDLRAGLPAEAVLATTARR